MCSLLASLVLGAVPTELPWGGRRAAGLAKADRAASIFWNKEKCCRWDRTLPFSRPRPGLALPLENAIPLDSIKRVKKYLFFCKHPVMRMSTRALLPVIKFMSHFLS
jgi:hypothetical protein